MAKSTRAHQRQKNNTALRARVFAPAEKARAERLSEKLMQIASQPSANELQKQNEMEVEHPKPDPEQHKAGDDEMDIDDNAKGKIAEQRLAYKRPSRVQKKRRGKPHSQIVFPSRRKDRTLNKSKKRTKKHAA